MGEDEKKQEGRKRRENGFQRSILFFFKWPVGCPPCPKKRGGGKKTQAKEKRGIIWRVCKESNGGRGNKPVGMVLPQGSKRGSWKVLTADKRMEKQ